MVRKSILFKLMCCFVSGAAIFLTITAICWRQINYNNLLSTNKLAHNAIREIDKLLGEASQAISLTSSLTLPDCSVTMRRQLSKIAIGVELVRVISIYRGDVLVCSSYDSLTLGKPRADFSKLRLEMLQDAYFTHGTSVMVLREMSDGFLVTSSLSTQWSANVLNMFSETNPLSLRINNKILDKNNIISIHEDSKSITNEIESNKYPYSIIYPLNNNNHFRWYLRNTWLTLTLALIIGFLSGAMTWIFFFREKTLYEKLDLAIKNGNIHPWYQPIYNYSTGRITGVEVLARWIKSNGQVVSPHEFIPTAEKTDLIINLTRSIMNRSTVELNEIVPCNEAWTVGVNFTRRHITEPGFVTECVNYVDSFRKNNITLVAELTEREPFDKSELLVSRVKALHLNGVKIALDDFGTGYANLNYINRLFIDIVKIDRSFVSRLHNATSGRLLEEIINLSQNLGLKIVAEGVETHDQAEWLYHRKVLLQQGYLYSPPLSFEQLRKLLNII